MPDVAKVVDFGLVKPVVTTETEATMMGTSQHLLVGTPMYMAPEAIKGEQFVDGRSDLYALGAVGYFLLTGSPVFSSNNVVEIVAHHLHTVPTPPSQRIGRAVPPDLEAVLMQCLAKDPGARFGTARELAHALVGCVETTPWSLERAAELWASFNPSRPSEDHEEPRQSRLTLATGCNAALTPEGPSPDGLVYPTDFSRPCTRQTVAGAAMTR